MCDPAALATKNGSPPTLRKARTGELTPPGINLLASAKREELVIPEAKCTGTSGKLDPGRPLRNFQVSRCFDYWLNERPLRTHLERQIFDIRSYDIPVTFRFEIGCLIRSEFLGTGYESCL